MVRRSMSTRPLWSFHSLARFVVPLVLAVKTEWVCVKAMEDKCLFYYEEQVGSKDIPLLPTRLLNDDSIRSSMPDCPPGLYDNETWPHDGCRMACMNNIGYTHTSGCITAGYITGNKSVLFMSCSEASKQNPGHVNIESCNDFTEWVGSHELTTNQSLCGECRGDYCVPPSFHNLTEPVQPQNLTLLESRPSSLVDEGSSTPIAVLMVCFIVLIVAIFAYGVTRGYYVMHPAPPRERPKHTPDLSDFFNESATMQDLSFTDRERDLEMPGETCQSVDTGLCEAAPGEPIGVSRQVSLSDQENVGRDVESEEEDTCPRIKSAQQENTPGEISSSRKEAVVQAQTCLGDQGNLERDLKSKEEVCQMMNSRHQENETKKISFSPKETGLDDEESHGVSATYK